jgi:HEAT repeat protein
MFAFCELERFTDEKTDAFIEKYSINTSINTEFQNIFKTRNSIETSSKVFLRNPLELSLWVRLLNTRISNITDAAKKKLNPGSFEFFDYSPSNKAELYRNFVSEIFNTYKVRKNHLSHNKTLFSKTYIEGTEYKKIFSQRKRSEKIYFQETTSLKRINFNEETIGITDLEIFISNLAFKLQRKNKYSCSYDCALQVAEESARTGKSNKIKAESLLEACLESGILTENRFRVNSEARLGISRPLQEYFASFQLKTHFENGMDISEAYRCPRWGNVVIFTSEITEAADKLVDSIILSENLDLASKCLINCSPETKEKLCTLLLKKIDTKYSVEKIRTIQSLGRLGACGINCILKAFKDTDVWVRREAATVLGETKSELALLPLETALGDEDFSVRIEAVRALGRIGSDKAVELLKDVFGDKNRAVRLEAAEALMKIGSEKALEILISALGAKDDFVRFGAIRALSRTNSQPVVKTLIKLFQEENKLIRLGAAEALGQMKAEKAIESFVKALEDEDEFVRWIALKTLGEIKSDRTSDIFINMLSDKSRFVRREAVKGLAAPGSGDALYPLVSALSDEDEYVRKAAAASLGEMGSELATEEIASKTLINKLEDESHFVRLEAAKALGMIKVRKAVFPLLLALGDENSFVRKEAADALGKLGSEKIIDPLMAVFESGNTFMRQGAVRALRKINPYDIPEWISNRVFNFLDTAFKDEDKLVRREAAKALLNISKSRPERAFESLIKALDNEDPEVRRLAAESLELFDLEKAINPLIDALKSEDPIVRRFAARALGQIGPEKAQRAEQPLIDDLIFDNIGSVREEAARALGKINSKNAIEPLVDALMDENNGGRSGAAEALGQLKADIAIDYLIISLTDTDEFTRLAAAKALGKIKPKKAILPLFDTLYDWNRFVKVEAINALNEICTEEDEAQLKTLLDSENEFIANLAFEILEKIRMEQILKSNCFSEEKELKNARKSKLRN